MAFKKRGVLDNTPLFFEETVHLNKWSDPSMHS